MAKTPKQIQKEYRERNIEKERDRCRKKYWKYREERPEIFKKWYDKYKETPKAIWKGYKNNARIRKIKITITFEYFMEFWQKPCSYCGTEIKKLGIDRIDNKKGYEKGNLKSCCEWCNKMKMDHTEKDFIAQCKSIISHY